MEIVMTYEVGDRVKIVKPVNVNETQGYWASPMDQYDGLAAQVIRVVDTGNYRLDIDDGSWAWRDSFLEPIKSDKKEIKIMKELKDLKVGDTVYHIDGTDSKIIAITDDFGYPLETNGGRSFTRYGREFTDETKSEQVIYPFPVKVVPVEYDYYVAFHFKRNGNKSVSGGRYKTIDDFYEDRLAEAGYKKSDYHWAEIIQKSKREI